LTERGDFKDNIRLSEYTDIWPDSGVSMRQSAELFRALADETRLRILNLLVRGELCVCDIMSVLDIGQSKASRHLAYLRNVGLVDDRREGVWMHYTLAEPGGVTHRRVLEWLAEAATELPQAAADLKALQKSLRRAQRCSDNGATASGNRKLLLADAKKG
jgi:ArsR family transcriptional regulator, arsenate/arsenite/antimonite-responsive transcriptional repressor